MEHQDWQESWRGCAPNSQPKPRQDLCFTKRIIRMYFLLLMLYCQLHIRKWHNYLLAFLYLLPSLFFFIGPVMKALRSNFLLLLQANQIRLANKSSVRNCMIFSFHSFKQLMNFSILAKSQLPNSASFCPWELAFTVG